MSLQDHDLLSDNFGHSDEQSGEREAFEPKVVEVRGGELVLNALPSRFTENTVVEVIGSVRGREETQKVEVRTDLDEIELYEREGFWAIQAHWKGTDEPTLLMDGNFFAGPNGEPMVNFTTPRSAWNYKEMGESLVGQLTPWDRYNIARFDSVSRVFVTTSAPKGDN